MDEIFGCEGFDDLLKKIGGFLACANIHQKLKFRQILCLYNEING